MWPSNRRHLFIICKIKKKKNNFTPNWTISRLSKHKCLGVRRSQQRTGRRPCRRTSPPDLFQLCLNWTNNKANTAEDDLLSEEGINVASACCWLKKVDLWLRMTQSEAAFTFRALLCWHKYSLFNLHSIPQNPNPTLIHRISDVKVLKP